MDEKKNLFRLFKCLGLSIGIAVMCFGCFVLVVDPFYQYHAPWLNIPVVLEDAVYQTAGAARNLEYDSAIVGTSMTENFHTSWFDEEMGWNTMKLSYSGARSNDLNAILEQISCREECLNHVVLDINEYQLTSEKWIQYVDRPEYLYDSKWINDYKYLYNPDVYVRCIERCIDGKNHKEDNIDSAYTWEDEELFGAEIAKAEDKDLRDQLLWHRASYVTPENLYGVSGKLSEEFPAKKNICQDNLDNIIPFIENNPHTQIHVIIPPYSMLYWEVKLLSENLEDTLGIYAHAIKSLLQYDNVTVYYFQYEPDIISDLDNYRDSTHHKPEYNKYMFECIRDGKHIVTLENYEEALMEMYEYAKIFDYISLWE